MNHIISQDLGGPHGPSQVNSSCNPLLVGNYAQDFREAMRCAGINFHEKIIGDGAIHRFSTDKKGDKDGWYVFYGLAGAFGDWKKDIHEKWSLSRIGLLKKSKQLSPPSRR